LVIRGNPEILKEIAIAQKLHVGCFTLILYTADVYGELHDCNIPFDDFD